MNQAITLSHIAKKMLNSGWSIEMKGVWYVWVWFNDESRWESKSIEPSKEAIEHWETERRKMK